MMRWDQDLSALVVRPRPGETEEEMKESFMTRVDTRGECWLFDRGETPGRWDYGSFRGEQSHRFSYAIFKGGITCDLWVLHECDTPGCVRPTHLRLGTASDNMRDMIRRGRHNHRGSPYARGDRND